MSMNHLSAKQFASLVVASLIAPCALAVDGQSTTPDGAAFASASAGDQYFSSLNAPGYAVQNGINDPYINSQVNTSGVGGTATASASNAGIWNSYPYSNDATGIATVGTIKLHASNNGSLGVAFPGASASAGWNDQFTLTGGAASGTAGIWVVPILINGTMSAVGNGASGTIQVAAYKDHNVLQPYGDPHNGQAYNTFTSLNTTHNGTIYFSWDYQMVAFGVTDYGPGDPGTLQSMSINRTLYFAIPFTWGASFSAGFYANMMAAERAYGAFAGQNATDLDLAHTILWGGPGYVIGSEGNITDFSIGSASGFNYGAPAPVPGTLLMAAPGLAGIIRRRRAM